MIQSLSLFFLSVASAAPLTYQQVTDQPFKAKIDSLRAQSSSFQACVDKEGLVSESGEMKNNALDSFVSGCAIDSAAVYLTVRKYVQGASVQWSLIESFAGLKQNPSARSVNYFNGDAKTAYSSTIDPTFKAAGAEWLTVIDQAQKKKFEAAKAQADEVTKLHQAYSAARKEFESYGQPEMIQPGERPKREIDRLVKAKDKARHAMYAAQEAHNKLVDKLATSPNCQIAQNRRAFCASLEEATQFEEFIKFENEVGAESGIVNAANLNGWHRQLIRCKGELDEIKSTLGKRVPASEECRIEADEMGRVNYAYDDSDVTLYCGGKKFEYPND